MLFDKAVADGSPQQQLASSDWGAKDFFASELTKIGGIEKVGLCLTLQTYNQQHVDVGLELLCVVQEIASAPPLQMCTSGREFASIGGCLRLSCFTWYS